MKILRVLGFLLATALCSLGQSVMIDQSFSTGATVSPAAGAISISGTFATSTNPFAGMNYIKLEYVPQNASGVTSCTVQVDSQDANGVWTPGGAIASTSCATQGVTLAGPLSGSGLRLQVVDNSTYPIRIRLTGGLTTFATSGSGTITGVTAGTGLSGGGVSGTVTLNLANTTVTPGSYTNTNLTVDQQGRITAAASGSGGSGTPCTVTAASLQYNNAGAFGCVTYFTFAGSTITGVSGGILDLHNLTSGGLLLPGALPTGLVSVTTSTGAISSIAITLTPLSTGFSVAGGTTSKTLTVSNTLTLAGTDSSTLNIGAGGTLGTGAFATIANYCALSGGANCTMTGKLITVASAAGGAGLNLPHGAAPTSPVNGDCWTTTLGLYCQINGGTVGPYGTATALSFPATVSGTTTSGGIPYFSNVTTLTSSAALTQFGVVFGGGAGGAPTSSAQGALNMPLIGQGAANPIFSTISYPTSMAAGSILYGGSTTAITTLASTGYSVLITGTTNPQYSTPTANGQCFMSAAASFATTVPSFQSCPGGTPSFPVTVAGTVTSGGIPYFSSTTVESSSALLTANGLVLGGGAGTAPFTAAGLSTNGVSQLALGVAGTSVGSVQFNNATSGTITLQPATGALGSITLTMPAFTSTIVGAATSTTATQALFATATAGQPAYRAIALTDLPTITPANGGTGLVNPTAHSLVVAEGVSSYSLVTSPSVNGFYQCGFNVSASAAVDPTCTLGGIPVDATNPATLLYSDRGNYLNWTSGATLTLPAISGQFASNMAFVVRNTSGGTLALTPTTPNNIDGGSSQAVSNVLNNFAAFTYSDVAGPNWFTIKVPTAAIFPAGLLAVANGGTGLGSGTNGGILGFTATGTIASSGILNTNVLVKGGGAGATPTNSDLTEAGNVLANSTTTQAWTITGGADASANSVLGNLTLRGASQTGAGGATSQGGSAFLTGGSNAATNAASQAGGIELIPGASTGATQGLQGLSLQGSVYIKGATVTQWNLECESAAMTVTDCGATPNNWLGVAEVVNTNTVQVMTDQQIFVNASAAVTLGHTVCAGSTAGKVTDSTGTATCTNAQGSTVGIVMATSGTWVLPDGTSVTATTTLPLIQMNTASQLAAGGGSNTYPITVAGTVTSGGIPYFSSTTVQSSSALLAANGVVLGGGAGGAPATVAGITTNGTSQLQLGVAGTSVGSVQFNNATSGSITLQPATGALGSITLTMPAFTSTVVAAATSTTTTQALFATATAGQPAYRAIATTDLPGIPINGVVSATGAITPIALGNNPLGFTCALTSGTTCLNVTEATAATTAGAVNIQGTTLTTSTAIGLQLTQGAAGPANAAAPNVITISAAAAGGAAGASNNGSAGAAISLLTGAGSAGGATTGVGGVGGAFTITQGAGGNAGGTATNNGGNGGGVAWTTGAGGNGGTGAATAGSGGNFVVTLGAPGTNSATGTAGAVGQFQVTGNAPATTGNAAGVAAGTIFNLVGVAGGASSSAAGTAGVGSAVSINGGIGGAGTGTNAVGGAGGAINNVTGNGGASAGTGANANGGNFSVTLGKAGIGGSGAAGASGQFVVSGTAIASSATSPGLSAGTLFLVNGLTGGGNSTATGTAGVGSLVSINSGIGGTATGATAGTGGAGGALSLISGAGGVGSGTGSGGVGGAVNITAGAGGNSVSTSVNANGGSIVLTPGAAGTGGSGTAGLAGVVSIAGANAGFIGLSQGSANTTANTNIPANTIIDQAPTAVTAYSVTRPGTAAQGIAVGTLSGSVITQGYSGDANHSTTVNTSTATSIGSTSLCSTAICPAGTYRVSAYIDVTTACTTTGAYLVSIIYTDDTTVSKTIVMPLIGTGVTATLLGPSANSSSLAESSTVNFGQGSMILRSTGTASINYSTTATPCGTGGPGIGKLYLVAETIQ